MRGTVGNVERIKYIVFFIRQKGTSMSLEKMFLEILYKCKAKMKARRNKV